MNDSRRQLDAMFRKMYAMASLLFLSAGEGFLFQRSPQVEFWLVLPNIVVFSALLLMVVRAYFRYLRAYFRESAMNQPSARWYQRLQNNPTNQTRPRIMWSSLIVVLLVGVMWILIIRSR